MGQESRHKVKWTWTSCCLTLQGVLRCAGSLNLCFQKCKAWHGATLLMGHEWGKTLLVTKMGTVPLSEGNRVNNTSPQRYDEGSCSRHHFYLLGKVGKQARDTTQSSIGVQGQKLLHLTLVLPSIFNLFCLNLIWRKSFSHFSECRCGVTKGAGRDTESQFCIGGSLAGRGSPLAWDFPRFIPNTLGRGLFGKQPG